MAIDRSSYENILKGLEANLTIKLFDVVNYEYYNTLVYDLFGKVKDDDIFEGLIQPLNNEIISATTQFLAQVDTAKKHVDSLLKNNYVNGTSAFSVLVNDISRKYDGRAISDTINEFFNAHQELSSNKEAIRNVISKIIVRLKEVFKEETRSFLNNLEKEVKKDNEMIAEVNYSNTDKINLGQLANYTEYKVSGNSFISKTGESIPFRKSGKNTFVSKNDELVFYYDNDLIRFTEGNDVFTFANSYAAMGPRDNQEYIKIKYGFDEISFLINEKVVTDPVIVNYICDEFRKKCPRFYETQLMTNPTFKTAEEKALADEYKTSKFLEEPSGRIKINKENEESLNALLASIGYSIEERKEGIYLTDQSGVSYRANIVDGDIIMLDNGVQIRLDVYQVHKNKGIKGPVMRYQDPGRGLSIYAMEDFSGIIVYMGENMYSISIVDNSLEVHGVENKKSISDFNHITDKIAVCALGSLKNILKTYRMQQEHAQRDNQKDTEYFNLINELEEKIKADSVLDDGILPTFRVDEINEEQSYDLKSIDEQLLALQGDSKVQKYLELMNKRFELLESDVGKTL